MSDRGGGGRELERLSREMKEERREDRGWLEVAQSQCKTRALRSKRKTNGRGKLSRDDEVGSNAGSDA